MSLKLVIQRTIPNKIIHWVDGNEVWASSGYKLYVSKNKSNTFSMVKEIPASPFIKMLNKSQIMSRSLRLGVRAFLKLKNGNILVVADRKIFCLNDGSIEETYSFEHGVGPLRDGLCEDNKGKIYVGEYFPNNARKFPVKLLWSEDQGRSWQVIRSLKGIRHVHCVQYDPYNRKIWMCTGDRDEESSISFSEDEGETWAPIGKSDQTCRTVSLLFTKDYVYWGTDTPTRQSYICRYERKNGKIEQLAPMNGPVYYSNIQDNGTMFFSTGVEGDSEGKSAAWDKRAHIWASSDGSRWEDLVSWEKDSWPYIMGYGRVLFARGQSKDVLAFTTQCLKNIDNTSFVSNVVVEP